MGKAFMLNHAIREKFVLSVGGSLIVPKEGIDTNFLKNLSKFIRGQIEENPNRQFFLVAGGGDTARRYIEAAQEVIGHTITDEDKDWQGIHATRLNAQLLRNIFKDIAHPYVLKHYDEFIRKVSEGVVCAAGWKPGRSTDYCAVTICQDYNIPKLINMTNIDQVYDKDPAKFPNASPIKKTTWAQFKNLMGSEWVPGMNTPFDPIASELAQQLNLTAAILNGRNFDNLKNCLDGKEFIGTEIEGD